MNETVSPANSSPASSGWGERARRTVIEPTHGWQAVNFGELWRYRELLYFLVWRDVKIRYKQTALGAAWAVLQPLMAMIVFTLFIGKLGGMEATSSVPYPILVFSAMLPWQFFANSVSQGGNSLVNSAHLISKVYFPRLLIPLSTLGAPLLDLLISFVLLGGMMGYYALAPATPVERSDRVAVVATGLDGEAVGNEVAAEEANGTISDRPKTIRLGGQLLLLPLFLLLTFLTSLAVGSLLSALTIAYRDFRYVVPFLMQTWMFVTPVVYSLDIVPEKWRMFYALNPMVGAIVGFRRSVTGEVIPWSLVGISLLTSLLFLVLGLLYFRRIERRFADIV